MAWAAVGGAAISVAGGLLSSSSQKKAAKAAAAGAQFTPYNVQGLSSGGVQIGKDEQGRRVIQVDPSGQSAIFQDALMQQVLRETQGAGPNAGLEAMIRQSAGGSTIPGLFADFQRIGINTPEQALLAANNFGRIGSQQNLFGQRGIQEGFRSPTAGGLTDDVRSRGLALLDQQGPQSFNQLAAQRLTQLREQARPQEERAVNSKFQNLFNTGRLGTTGGAQAIGELALAQEQADIGRQISADDLASRELQNSRSFFNSQQLLGQSLLGQAFQGIGQDQARAAQLGAFGANFFNQQGQTEAARLAAFQTGDQASLSRGQQRLQTAQQVFGFGDAITQTGLDRTAQRLGLAQSVDQQLLDQARLGASVGQAQASAGANAGALAMRGAGSPLGAALSGLGAGISGGNFNGFFGGLFNKPAAAPAQAPAGQAGATAFFNPNLAGISG